MPTYASNVTNSTHKQSENQRNNKQTTQAKNVTTKLYSVLKKIGEMTVKRESLKELAFTVVN